MAELSIIIPVYNVDSWLNECLNSIRNQTFADFECILVDDGSTDFSGVMCDSFAKNDKRFIVVHQENSGVSAARNTGIDIAGGNLLTFVDPDDFIPNDYYYQMVNVLHSVGADFTKSKTEYVEENGSVCKDMKLAERVFPKLFPYEDLVIYDCNEKVQEALCRNAFSCVCWGKVYTKNLWGDAHFPTGIDLGEDMMTVPRTLLKASKAAEVNTTHYCWRQRKKSLLHGTISRERLIMDLQASTEMYKQLCEQSPDRWVQFDFLKLHYDVGCLMNFKEKWLRPKNISDLRFAIKVLNLMTTNNYLGAMEETLESVEIIINEPAP